MSEKTGSHRRSAVARFPGVCRLCGSAIEPGMRIWRSSAETGLLWFCGPCKWPSLRPEPTWESVRRKVAHRVDQHLPVNLDLREFAVLAALVEGRCAPRRRGGVQEWPRSFDPNEPRVSSIEEAYGIVLDGLEFRFNPNRANRWTAALVDLVENVDPGAAVLDPYEEDRARDAALPVLDLGTPGASRSLMGRILEVLRREDLYDQDELFEQDPSVTPTWEYDPTLLAAPWESDTVAGCRGSELDRPQNLWRPDGSVLVLIPGALDLALAENIHPGQWLIGMKLLVDAGELGWDSENSALYLAVNGDPL